MTKAFVSYKRKDTEFARKLVDALIAKEMEVWIDWESIPPTVDWKLQIQKGVEEADIFLFLLSPEALKSRECAEELDHAVRNGKRLIPLVVREVNPEEVPKELKHINWIYFDKKDGFDKAFQKLMEAIQTDYEWVQTHRRLQVKALEWERAHKENSFLLRGKDLEFAEGQLVVNASKDPKPTDLQREHILRSKKARETQRRVTTGISIGVAVVMLFLAIFAINNAAEADRQKLIAVKNENIAKANEVRALNAEESAERSATVAQIGKISALALSEIDQDYNEALLYSVEAYQRAVETGSNQAKALSTLTLLTSLLSRSGLSQILPEHNDWISNLAYSPDGKTLATSSWDFATHLWDISNPGNPVQLKTLKASGVLFSPNGELLITAGQDEQYNYRIGLWDITDRANPSQRGELQSETEGIYGLAAITRDDSSLITLGYTYETGGSIVQIWDISNPSSPALVTTLDGWYAALSPEGTTLAIASYDENSNSAIYLWDITIPAAPVQLGTLPGYLAAFNPDGRSLAVLNDDGRGTHVTIWDTANPLVPVELGVLRGHADTVSSIAFSRDGTTIALGSEDGKIYLWDVNDPVSLPYRPYTTLNGHSTSVSQIAFSPVDDLLITGGADGTVMLWNLANIYNPLRMNIGGQGFTIADSPNGKFSATQAYDEFSGAASISIWDSKDPTNPIELSTTKSDQYVDFALLSDDGKHLAISSYNDEEQANHIYWWDVADPSDPIQTEIPAGVTSYPAGLSPNGNALLLTDYDEESQDYSLLTLWNLSDPTNPTLLQTLDGVSNNGILFGPTGNTLVISGYDTRKQLGILMLWDLASPDGPVLVDTLDNILGGYGVYSPDGSHIALIYEDDRGSSTVVWDVSTSGKYTELSTLRGTNATFSPDGEAIAIETRDADEHPIVQLWDTSNLSEGSPIDKAEGYSPVYSPSGNRIIIRRDDIQNDSQSNDQNDAQGGVQQGIYNMLIWDIADPSRPVSQPLVGHTNYIAGIAFSADEKMLASSGMDKTIILWDISSPAAPTQIARLQGHTAAVTTVTFSPDGLMLASGGDDQNIILWGLSDPKDIVEIGTLRGHSGGIYKMVFSGDGKRLISYGGYENIVWDLDPDSWMRKACDLAGSNFTEEGWRERFGDEPYHQTCESETVEYAPVTETQSTESESPVLLTTALCAEDRSLQSCLAATLEERDLFCVEKTPYTLYAMPEGGTLESATDGFSCTDEGVRNGYQLYTCYGPPAQQFTGEMCSPGCVVEPSSLCPDGYGLDWSRTCCTPVTADGCSQVTLAIGSCQ